MHHILRKDKEEQMKILLCWGFIENRHVCLCHSGFQYHCSRPSAVVCSPGCQWGVFEHVKWWWRPAAEHPGRPYDRRQMLDVEGSGPGCLWHTHWPPAGGGPPHTPPALSPPAWTIRKWKALQTIDKYIMFDEHKYSCRVSRCVWMPHPSM